MSERKAESKITESKNILRKREKISTGGIAREREAFLQIRLNHEADRRSGWEKNSGQELFFVWKKKKAFRDRRDAFVFPERQIVWKEEMI